MGKELRTPHKPRLLVNSTNYIHVAAFTFTNQEFDKLKANLGNSQSGRPWLLLRHSPGYCGHRLVRITALIAKKLEVAILNA